MRAPLKNYFASYFPGRLTTVEMHIRNLKVTWNPYWDQYHRTTRVPDFSMVSVFGDSNYKGFVQSVLNSHAPVLEGTTSETPNDLVGFANKVGASNTWKLS